MLFYVSFIVLLEKVESNFLIQLHFANILCILIYKLKIFISFFTGTHIIL
jgi:hypothetical protein